MWQRSGEESSASGKDNWYTSRGKRGAQRELLSLLTKRAQQRRKRNGGAAREAVLQNFQGRRTIIYGMGRCALYLFMTIR